MYLYDETLGIHINTSPLLVSSRVLKAARDLDPAIQIEWDENGFICGVHHGLAMKLTTNLGMRTLSVQEYMQLARRHSEMQSEDFSEWLSDTYVVCEENDTPLEPNGAIVLKRDPSISPPTLVSTNAQITVPVARPGWFDLHNTRDDGIPTKLSSVNQPGQWKFWSPESTKFTCGAMRSFVTSSGTCSLDLGIPVFAKHPKIMIRECYENFEAPILSPLLTSWPTYEKLTRTRDYNGLKKFLADLNIAHFNIVESKDEFLYQRDKERLVDWIGKKRLLENDTTSSRLIDEAMMLDTLRSTPDDRTFFVMGHARPDADSIMSSVFEAVRRHLVYPDQGSLPWSESIPREVEHILGPAATDLLSKIDPPSRHNSIVLVDCHQVDSKYQMGVRAIIDHHVIDKKFPEYVALSYEVSWSSTIQVYVKILGSGLDLSPTMAQKLLEATRLEAEPTLLSSMSEIDRLAMQRLESITGIGRAATYYELMGIMVNDAEVEELFFRDYRQTLFGFAVIKCNKSQDYMAIALSNNMKSHLPLTVVKEVVYAENFGRIQSETILLVTNPTFHDKGFKKALRETVAAACRQFHGEGSVVAEKDIIILQDIESQTPRLLLMPLIQTIVKEHMRFTYASSIDRYVSLGFFGGSQELYGSPGDENFVKTGLSFLDVKALLKDNKHTSFLTLPEYWRVYHEMERNDNISALQSLQHDRYVELLDTLISQSKTIGNGSNSPEHVSLKTARPALIRAKEGDENTGIPTVLYNPDKYGDSTLWRYWSPDLAENVATRGHIFVMNQTCIDLKVRPEERTKQLTFRPLYIDIPDIHIRLEPDPDSERWIKVIVSPRLFSVH